MKPKGLYLILLLLLIGLLSTTLSLYRKASETLAAQETAQNMQSLLESSDIFSSNLGSVQQYFRNFVAQPSSKISASILFHKSKSDSALTTMKTIGKAGSSLRSLTLRMDSTYAAEGARIIAFINSSADFRKGDSNASAASEARMDMVWTILFEYRKMLKQGIIEQSIAVKMIASDLKRLSLISICLLVGLALSTILVLYQRQKQSIDLSRKLVAFESDSTLMRSLLDNTTTSMHIVDNDGKIIYANEAFLKFIGLPQKQVLLKRFAELDSPKSLEFEKPEVRSEYTKSPFELEETVVVDGELRYFFTRKHNIKDVNGDVFASATISRDVTERTLSDKGFEISRQEAEHARLTQEQFMANISHEIRTPMNGIVGMTDLLSGTSLNAEQRDYLDTIKQSSTNLISLINDILDFSKIEAGMLQIEQIPFKVSAVIEQSLNSLKVKANAKEIYLDCEIDHKVPAIVIGDPLRLYQIVSNVLSNAIKFTIDGGVKITVSAMVFKAPEIKLVIKVSDTGIGIPKERLDYIFNSFAQSSLDITRKFGGTGLGLTIVKQLVEMQGGFIMVDSNVGEGSCFTIHIPFETSVPETWSAEESAKFSLLKGREVLVVEDNLINQKVILRTLENAGLNASIVDSGLSAIDILKQRKFQVVIMDIQMPDMDGRETTMQIRRELMLEVPIIAMTASVSSDERQRCLDAGMDDYIAKPFVKEDLFEKLLLHVD